MKAIDLENLISALVNQGKLIELPESGTYQVKASPQQSKDGLVDGTLYVGDDGLLRINDEAFRKEK